MCCEIVLGAGEEKQQRTVHPMICLKEGTLDLKTGMMRSNSTEYEEDAKNSATVGSGEESLMLALQAWLVSSIAK